MRQLILELGLRYRPSDPDALADHTARLALLADDLGDIPALALEAAIRHWSAGKPWLPRACDLAELAQRLSTPAADRAPISPAEQIAARNAYLEAIGNYRIRWVLGPDGAWLPTDFADWRRRQAIEAEGVGG